MMMIDDDDGDNDDDDRWIECSRLNHLFKQLAGDPLTPGSVADPERGETGKKKKMMVMIMMMVMMMIFPDHLQTFSNK